MTRQELCAALDAQLAAAQEQVCVLAVPLAGGVPLYERGAGRRAVSASTIKVFILLAALDEVRRGRLALDTPVAVTAEDILPDTGVFVDGPGMHPLEELLVWMIVLSDNTATNVLIGLLLLIYPPAGCQSDESTYCQKNIDRLSQRADMAKTVEIQILQASRPPVQQ